MGRNLDELINDITFLLSAEPSLDLTKIARRLGVDRHTLERTVQRSKGMCFREYKKRLKFAKARLLLTDHPNLSCKYVALSLGYRSPASFSRFVKAIAGRAPTETKENSKNQRKATQEHIKFT